MRVFILCYTTDKGFFIKECESTEANINAYSNIIMFSHFKDKCIEAIHICKTYMYGEEYKNISAKEKIKGRKNFAYEELAQLFQYTCVTNPQKYKVNGRRFYSQYESYKKNKILYVCSHYDGEDRDWEKLVNITDTIYIDRVGNKNNLVIYFADEIHTFGDKFNHYTKVDEIIRDIEEDNGNE